MSNVINLTRPEPLIWVCNCGCSTFKLYSDDTMTCAQCGTTGTAKAEWVKEPAPAEPKAPEKLEQVSSVSSTAEWTLRKLLKVSGELALVIGIDASGKTVLWGNDCTTPERIDWLDRQFAKARLMLTKDRQA